MNERLPSVEEIRDLLGPFGVDTSAALLGQLHTYLGLLVRWNERTNLTAVRDPRKMVERHFGESLYAARVLPAAATLLDYGSGAGFPGLPIQLSRPEMRVTLAESQHRKASFLREVVRTLELGTEVWAGRVEAMPASRTFDVVTLRAVDGMEAAMASACERTGPGGFVASLEGHEANGSESEGAVFPMPFPGVGRIRVQQRL